jgi:hypothetical protein
MYLRVSPTQGVKRFGIKGQLAPRYNGPFLIWARLGNVAYRLELPPTFVGVHNVFHVSQLKKCLKPPVDVIVNDVTSIDADLSYPEHPVKVLGQQDRVTRHRMIRFFKFNGAITLSKRLHGRPENSFVLSTQSFSLRSNAYVTFLAPPLANLNQRVL